MEFCIDKKTKERIFAFDIKNEYGIKDFFLEKKLRRMSANEELVCPECGTPVILRAGEINIPHFSHKIKTKDCFYSTYTYNENRVKALKILYDKLKKYEDVKILEISKKFKGYGVIDILLEKEEFPEKRKYAIMIKNTMENINKWEKLHIELLKEEITPIYLNYGTTKEINDFQKEISKSFFYRNLMNLTTNHGIRLVNIEEQELYTISTTFYLNENNRLKNYKNILHKNDYKDFFEFIFNSKGENTYIFLDEKKQNYAKELLKYKEKFEPFLMININQEIFLVLNIESSSLCGEEDYECLEIKYIPLNYFMFSSINLYMYMYFYINEQSFKDEYLSDYCSLEDEEKIKEFFNSPDFDIVKIIPIEEAGIFKNDIEEFIKNYGEIKNKIFDYDYISQNSKKEFELLKFKNLNNSYEISNFIKDKEINKIEDISTSILLNNSTLKLSYKGTSLEEIINFLQWQFFNFFEVVFKKSDIKKIINCLEDKIFSCNEDNEIIKLEELNKIFKELLKVNKDKLKLLFSKKEIKDYKITELFFNVFKEKETIFRYSETTFFCFNGEILSFFENNQFELNILNTYYKLTKKETIEEKELNIFKDSLERYLKNKDLDLFLKNINKVKKESQEKFFIETLDYILAKNAKELILFIAKNINLNKSIKKTYEILDYFLNKNIKCIIYKSFIEKMIQEKNIILFEAILEIEYEDKLTLDDIASILSYNYKSEIGNNIIKKNILNKKINLNKQNKNGTSLFYYLCSKATEGDFIDFCLKNGANLYLKNEHKKTPFMALEKRIENGQLNNFKLPKK